LTTATGNAGELQAESNATFDGSTLSITGNTQMTGSLTAASKSFDILHPTKKGYRLRYGVLEGPEHGVYFRGKTTEKVIELPDYWNGLVHEDSYTVNLTSIGKPCENYVVEIKDNKVFIDNDCGDINVFYLIHAERKDIEKVLLEYKPVQ
jgi:hypothetical protein